MMRLQIQLEQSQHRLLKRQAQRLGISVSELIRRCVTAQMQEDPAAAAAGRARRALAAAGRHAEATKRSVTARHHDAALAEAFKR